MPIIKRVVVIVTCALTGCAALPDEGPVAGTTVNDILNGVECEFAAYLRKYPRSVVAKKLKSGEWVAGGELETKVDTANGGSFGVNAAAIPAGSGAVGLGLGFDRSERRGRASKIRFRIPAKNLSKVYCDPATIVQGIGVENWLTQYSILASEGLPLEPKDLTYGLTFAVTSASKGSVTAIQAVRVSAEAFAKRDDVQLLAIAINPAPDPFTYVKIVSDAKTRSLYGLDNSPAATPVIIPVPTTPGAGLDIMLDQKRRELLP